MLGLDGAGKTEVAHRICKTKRKDYLPTKGCEVYEAQIGKYKIKISELGGDATIRDIWRHYYLEAYGIIFVIDSSDIQNLNAARYLLQSLLSSPHLEGKCFLIIGSKQDLPDALDYVDICYFLELESMVNNSRNPCRLEIYGMWENEQFYASDIDKSLLWLIHSTKKRINLIKNMIKYYQSQASSFRKISRPFTGPSKSSVRKKKIRPKTAPDVIQKPQGIRVMKPKLIQSDIIAFDLKTVGTKVTTKETNGSFSQNEDIDDPDSSSINITEAEVQVHRVDDHLIVDGLKTETNVKTHLDKTFLLPNGTFRTTDLNGSCEKIN